MNAPFKLSPSGKEYLWGGSRLSDEFGKCTDMYPLAETWECSVHPDGPSMVAGGRFQGRTLACVLSEHPEFLGRHASGPGGLPILVKLIDVRSDLSIQVHPDDEFARRHENAAHGKTEFWYVLDASEGASVACGLKRSATPDDIRRAVEEGTLGRWLHTVPVHGGDVFLIRAGTIHGISAGSLIAEIQQNCNITYRLYDYGRTDRDGRRRSLHIEKALAAADLRASEYPRQPMRVCRCRPGYAAESLCRCRHFQVELLHLNRGNPQESVEFHTDGTSFCVLLCVDGAGTMSWPCGEDGRAETIAFSRGDCLFVPADSASLHLHGKVRLLKVRC